MDKKDWTPEELQLKAALDKLYETDTRVPSKPLDLSFMENSPESNSQKKSHKTILRIVAVIAIILVSSFSTAVFISNDYATAMKTAIKQKIFTMNSGVTVISDDEFVEEGEVVWEINDYKTAVKAKEIIPELPLPGYIPEKYVFDGLILHLYDSGEYLANFNYVYKNNILYFTCQTNTGEYDSSMFSNLETIQLPDRTIFIWKDPVSDVIGSSIIMNDSLIIITFDGNTFDIDEIKKIATNLT